MEKKDKIEFCLKQAELGAARWDRRRTDEWKVTLLFWAGLLAAAKFAHGAKVVIPLVALCSGGTIFILLYVFVWLRGLWMANHNDKQWEMHFRYEAAKLMSSQDDNVSPPPSKTKPPLKMFLCSYSMIFQMAMTLIITILALMIIANTPQPQNDQTGNTKVTMDRQK